MYVILNEPNKIVVTVTYTLMQAGLILLILWNTYKLIRDIFEKPRYSLNYSNGKLLVIKEHRGKKYIKNMK
jgi:hypothetical protein